MVVCQRFGSALNLNVHFHAMVLDGVYTADGPLARPVFHPAPELKDEEVERLVRTVRERIVRLLVRRGVWPEPGRGRPPRSTSPNRCSRSFRPPPARPGSVCFDRRPALPALRRTASANRPDHRSTGRPPHPASPRAALRAASGCAGSTGSAAGVGVLTGIGVASSRGRGATGRRKASGSRFELRRQSDGRLARLTRDPGIS